MDLTKKIDLKISQELLQKEIASAQREMEILNIFIEKWKEELEEIEQQLVGLECPESILAA